MKIKQISIYQHHLHVKNGPYNMASGSVTGLDTHLVKIQSDNGLFGWGETCPIGPTYAESHAAGAQAALLHLAPNLIGKNLDGLRHIHHQMDSFLNGHNYAKAAIDIAAHDLIGKYTGRSVSELLGGPLTNKVPSYYACSIGSADEVSRIAKEKVREGYKRIQVKVGGENLESAIEVIQKVWETIGKNAALVVDANRGWSQADTISFSTICSNIPMILEQPCNSVQELQNIRSQLHHPLYMDESGVSLAILNQAINNGFIDGFSMKVTRIGGLQPMSTFRDICDAHSMPHSCDDSWGGDIIAAACTHLGATVAPKTFEGTWIAAPYINDHYDRKNGVKVIDGHISLPTGSGLGIIPDEDQFGPAIAVY